jgi:GcrA cell cycle regulator
MTSPHKRRTWTEEEMAYLRANMHLSARQLAAHIGTTRNAVIGKMHRLGGTFISPIDQRSPAQRREDFLRRDRERRALQKLRQPPKPLSLPPPPPDGVNLFALDEHGCKWPVNDGVPEYLFCGHAVMPGCSYCRPHAKDSIGLRH